MKGLTRKERQLKQLLFMALDQLYSSQNAAEDSLLVHGVEP